MAGNVPPSLTQNPIAALLSTEYSIAAHQHENNRICTVLIAYCIAAIAMVKIKNNDHRITIVA